MDRNTIKTVLLTIVLIFVAFFIYGKFVGPVSFSIGNSADRTFFVTGTGSAKVVPNSFETNFNINETGTTQKEAQDKASAKQNSALVVLSKLGIEKKDIKTTNISVNPNYDYTSGQSKVTGYMADISTTVKSKDKTKIENAIEQITALGINISGISSSVTDDEEAKQEARRKALEDARSTAESMAKAGGFRLGQIQSISESDDNSMGPVMPLNRAVGGELDQKVAIEPGQDEVTSTVSVSFYIN